jgi:hypothetical protein
LGAMHSANLVNPRLRLWLRAFLAGPCSFALTALIMAVMPFWIPKGPGGVDHIAFPLFMMPAIWGMIFFYAVLDRSLARVATIMAVLAFMHAVALRGILSS